MTSSAAVAQQPQALLDVVGVLERVAVDEDQVVRAVAQLGQHGQGVAGDQPEPLARDAERAERLAGLPLVVGLEVDAGQDPVGLHAGEQGEPGLAGPGADLDDRAGLHGLGEEGQRARPCPRLERLDAQRLGLDPGLRGRVALGAKSSA